MQSAALVAMLASSASAIISSDGTGRLPSMGWSSWNEYQCNIDETVIVKIGDLFESLGLKDLGYEYVNIDDCWSAGRDDNNKLKYNETKFPQGISHVAEQIHDMGLKLGIYGDAGSATCAIYAGSLGFEAQDAKTWADWGIDFLKYDNCFYPESWQDEYPWDPTSTDNPTPPSGYDYSTSKTSQRYHAMGDELLKQSHTILFNLCAWGTAHVEEWGGTTGHSWRMFGDIAPAWTGRPNGSWGIIPIINQAAYMWQMWNSTGGFWGHNDWDMLEVGNGNLTFEENRSHFALWTALKSPLIIGAALDGIKDEVLGILKTKELIDFYQDGTYSEAARPFNFGDSVAPTMENTTHPPAYWVGTSTKGIHLYLLNADDSDQTMEVNFADTPGLTGGDDQEYMIHDMWTGEDIGTSKGKVSVDVKMHDTAALRLTTTDGKHPNPDWTPSDDSK